MANPKQIVQPSGFTGPEIALAGRHSNRRDARVHRGLRQDEKHMLVHRSGSPWATHALSTL